MNEKVSIALVSLTTHKAGQGERLQQPINPMPNGVAAREYW